MGRSNKWLWAGLGVLGGAALGYVKRREVMAQFFGLPKPRYGVWRVPDLRVGMRDGVTLSTDHFWPTVKGKLVQEPGATVLIRTPYGKDSMQMFAQMFVGQGYHVLIQDVRGQFASGGVFDAMVNEADDGADTVAWLREQSWSNGKVGMWGPSYLTFSQWAVVAGGEQLDAMFVMLGASQLTSLIQIEGTLALDLIVRWYFLLNELKRRKGQLSRLWMLSAQYQKRILEPVFAEPALMEADKLFPTPILPAYRQRFDRIGADHPYWEEIDHRPIVPEAKGAVHMMTGWYDIFLREVLSDYAQLRAAGQKPPLVIGPWHHTAGEQMSMGLRLALDWFDEHLRGGEPKVTSEARVYVMGDNAWRTFESWPPPAEEKGFYLQPGGGLAEGPSLSLASPSRYRYDPADPTPAVGGTMLLMPTGPQDNRELEARDDVLSFTSGVLVAPLTVIGHVRLVLYVRSSRPYTDFTGRLCVVKEDGRSINLCDGLFSVKPGKGEGQGDGSLRVEIDMWATAVTFQVGERIRLQVSSGMHPRYIRNPGTGESPLRLKRMEVAEQTVYHDEGRPSVLYLPVVDDSS
ncbi:MAG TPA: CocE/NonD family hydrolase [Anaerolineae bacterium]|nr:CocE/NonD family hydrolase [Anaerolineae bacterium]